MADTPFEGLSSLVQLSGTSVPARARFVGETLVSSLWTSMTIGFSCGVIGSATPMGPLVPFLLGSWTGYTFGLVNHWMVAHKATLKVAKLYPSLLAHSLAIETHLVVPSDVIKASEEELRLTKDPTYTNEKSHVVEGRKTLTDWINEGGLGRLSWSMIAAQGCRPDIEDIQRQHRQKLIEEHTEKDWS